jgi:thiol:disulfide interchange protein DsbD
MTTLKVVFGFVELALAIKFLSNIDLVYQLGILRWEPFLALWTMIALGAAAYLFGLFTFKPDQKENNISFGRKMLAVFFLASAGYMGYGMVTYTQISLFGMPPPVTYNYFNQVKVEEEYRNDLNGAIKASLASGKPIFMDFTGWACVNCRKMENEVWTLPNIKKIMKGQYILTSLYTDDRTALPDDKIYTSKFDQKEKNTVGKRLLDIQATHFDANSQPFYVLVIPDPKNPKTLRVLNTPVGYTPNVAEFEKFLNEGLKNK